MKARKVSGIRLLNYLNEGINLKDHGNILLAFWSKYKSQNTGFTYAQLNGFNTYESLPTRAKEAFESWVATYNFQNTDDAEWLKFVRGTLNIFYKTSDYQLMDMSTWYIYLFKSEMEAREIAETQVWVGDPHLEGFTVGDSMTLARPAPRGAAENRRNGYIFANELKNMTSSALRGFFWAIIFQCDEPQVRISYMDGAEKKTRCIVWAASIVHSTLLKITPDQRLAIIPVKVPAKYHMQDRHMPDGLVTREPMTPTRLLAYVVRNYYTLYRVQNEIDLIIKDEQAAKNLRRNALATMNDEQIKVSRVIQNLDEFIERGNVPMATRLENKRNRQLRHKRNKMREREEAKLIRRLRKTKMQRHNRHREAMNPF